VVIPLGGSNATGAHGYRLAAAEIQAQVHRPDHVVVALGSGGSMAGLVAGLGPGRVLGVHVGAVQDPRAVVAAILADMPGVVADPFSLRIQTDEVGDGYGTVTEDAADSLSLAGRTEGVALDPIYTARALSGLRAAVVAGDIRPGQTTVFLHTGGLPGLFGYPEAVTFGESAVRQFPLK
jgi:L-cysteate sulfo-lyase